ncbi:MAG: PIN domain-containing protein [Sulfuricellaceae bacterium]
MRLLLDTNVILDVLTGREPMVKDSAAVLTYIDEGHAVGLVAAHAVTTIYYLLTKHSGQAKASAAIVDLINLVRVAPVDHEVILQALSLGWRDFEDAVQGAAAVRAQATHLITRNPKDFSAHTLPVLSPGEFLALVRHKGK